MLDAVFKAYGDWIGAYHRRDINEPALRKTYMDLRSKLTAKEQLHWPT